MGGGPKKLTAEQDSDAAERCLSGWHIGEVAEEFGVTYGIIKRSLELNGVALGRGKKRRLIFTEAEVAQRRQKYNEKSRLWRRTQRTEDDREKRRVYQRSFEPAYNKTYKSIPKNRIRVLCHKAKYRARRDGLIYEDGLAADLMSSPPTNCPCCGMAISYATDHGKKNGLSNAPSLDRVDNTLGYVRGNVVIICKRCNCIKGDSSLSDLRTLIAYMKARPVI